jgi:hypothetical protein
LAAPRRARDNGVYDMSLRHVVALTAGLGAALLASPAIALVDAHQVGDDVQVTLDPAGTAQVRHRLRWRVGRGPLATIDLAGIPSGAQLEPVASVVAEDGRAVGGHVARRDDGRVTVTADEPRALSRGTFTFDVRWQEDLQASRALVRDGSTWRLTIAAPVAVDGFDGARVVLDAPAAPAEPRTILPVTGAPDPAALVTLRRDPSRDVLELVRPHVGRGEAMTWTVRLDRRALSAIPEPRPAASAGPVASPEPERVRKVAGGAALAAIALAFAGLVGAKARAFRLLCAANEATARALLPLPDGARAALAGLSLAAAVGLQAGGEVTGGGALVAVAILAAALRVPGATPRPRGPGRWLLLRPEEAFAPERPEGHWLDPDAREGRVTALIALALVVTAAATARALAPRGAWLVAIDASALLPVLLTGRLAHLPPSGARAAAPWLARLFRSLRSAAALRVAPWARVTLDGGAIDELRLLVLPRAPMPGVVGIEAGLAWTATLGGWIGSPEVLARVLEGSAAATRLAKALPHARTVPGRRADERVVQLLPRRPSRGPTAALLQALAEELTDRRAAVPARAWAADERRAPLPVRSPAVAA